MRTSRGPSRDCSGYDLKLRREAAAALSRPPCAEHAWLRVGSRPQTATIPLATPPAAPLQRSGLDQAACLRGHRVNRMSSDHEPCGAGQPAAAGFANSSAGLRDVISLIASSSNPAD